jgi:hypothetical protein
MASDTEEESSCPESGLGLPSEMSCPNAACAAAPFSQLTGFLGSSYGPFSWVRRLEQYFTIAMALLMRARVIMMVPIVAIVRNELRVSSYDFIAISVVETSEVVGSDDATGA